MMRFVFISYVLLSFSPMLFALNINYQYYPIYGSSYSQLLSQMNQKGPQGYHAYANWYINWRWHKSKRNGLCQLTDISVNLSATITFPKWQNPDKGNYALKKEWLRYSKALMEHEMGHIQHGIEAKAEITSALNQLGLNPSCRALANQANQIAQTIIHNKQLKDKQFDRNTQHGKTTGAAFNPP